MHANHEFSKSLYEKSAKTTEAGPGPEKENAGGETPAGV